MSNKTVNLIQLGFGTVGKEFVRQLANINLKFNLSAVFNSKGGWISNYDLTKGPKKLSNPQEVINVLGKNKIIIVDISNSDDTAEFLSRQNKSGASTVFSNKRPLCRPYQENLFDLNSPNIFYETTVGAGLPVIHTLKSLLTSGDRNIEISGNLSGTMGFIMSELEEGFSFSASVKKAKNSGYTETDPREDLRGTDVARKILILARTMGKKINLSDIKVQSLYPDKMDVLSVPIFMEKLKELDKYYLDLLSKAKKRGKTIRYLGFINKNKISAELMEIDKLSDLGNLRGPDNLIVFRSKRYNLRSLVIKGPGAGAEVTAAGVINDVISAAKAL